jgi:protein-L-isoaspartate(D-aspartate) O-methyltransferase
MADEQRHEDEWWKLRRRMVEEQIRRRGIQDQRVLDAMIALPRERFVPEGVRADAYQDRALPIGHDQTISQPYIVAYMTEQLCIAPDARVLEIGTGTGYQTALLALLAKHVFTIERIPALHEQATRNLTVLDRSNITMSVGDGSLGMPVHAPYDRIIATAGAPSVPGPLVDQLVDGGVLVIPVGGKTEQTIVRVVREQRRTIETPTLACRFVKLIGHEGWHIDNRGT